MTSAIKSELTLAGKETSFCILCITKTKPYALGKNLIFIIEKETSLSFKNKDQDYDKF